MLCDSKFTVLIYMGCVIIQSLTWPMTALIGFDKQYGWLLLTIIYTTKNESSLYNNVSVVSVVSKITVELIIVVKQSLHKRVLQNM